LRRRSLAGAPAEQVENVEHGLQIAGSGAIIELVAQAIEARDVACGEIHAVAVERVEVLIENRRRQRVVEPWQRIVILRSAADAVLIGTYFG
jgi:hypothetical protein